MKTFIDIVSVNPGICPSLPSVIRYGTMEGNIYRTNGLDCFTNGSLDLLADELPDLLIPAPSTLLITPRKNWKNF
ncbi:hypothetical protein PUN28_009484 [Cardiocondyla obscurior]|uniref:Uncharacterized protein n=1 Tax=Cardiocondyla obscurior TaxID=286306 RepID=A0AAW2FU15_9HYME